jgi:hypothetical protein
MGINLKVNRRIDMETINVYVTDYGEERLPKVLGDYVYSVFQLASGDGRLSVVKTAKKHREEVETALNTWARIAFELEVPLTKLLGE